MGMVSSAFNSRNRKTVLSPMLHLKTLTTASCFDLRVSIIN